MTKNKFTFSELLNEPIKVMALVYPYFLVVIVGIGFLYIGNSGALVQNKIAPVLDDSTVVVSDLPIAEAKVAAAVDLKSFSESSPALVEKGKQLFQNTCASCHGVEGMGDGAAGVALNPKPRNFHSADGWKFGRKATEIYSTLQKGILTSGMPGFDYLAPSDRIAIIQFIKTWMPNPPQDTPEDISNLDKTYALSAGIKIPGTVPVASAEKSLQTEYLVKIQKLNFVLSTLRKEKTQNTAAETFFDVTTDQQKALATLLNSTSWQVGEKEFLAVIADNLSTNGFSGKVFSLNSTEVSELLSLLKRIAV